MVAAAWSGAGDADGSFSSLTPPAPPGARASAHHRSAPGRRSPSDPRSEQDRPRRQARAAAADGNASTRPRIFSDVMMISAQSGDGVGDLVALVADRLPHGPWLFPDDQISDLAGARVRDRDHPREGCSWPLVRSCPTRSRSRPKAGPSAPTAVSRSARSSTSSARVRRESSSATRAAASARSASAARADLERLLGCRVHLFLFVRVQARWSDDPAWYRDVGLDFQAERARSDARHGMPPAGARGTPAAHGRQRRSDDGFAVQPADGVAQSRVLGWRTPARHRSSARRSRRSAARPSIRRYC